MIEADVLFLHSVSPSLQTRSALSELESQPIAKIGDVPRTACKVVTEKSK